MSGKRQQKRQTPEPKSFSKRRPAYLEGFGEHCVKKFDVPWVLAKLAGSPPPPPWYRSLLTLMLLGWAFAPKIRAVRKSLAWHFVNEILDKSARKAMSDIDKNSYWGGITIARTKHDDLRWVYRPLGGQKSKDKLSWSEVITELASHAAEAEKCLFILDIAVTASSINGPTMKPVTLGGAKKIFEHWRLERDEPEDFERTNTALQQTPTSKSRKYSVKYAYELESLILPQSHMTTRDLSISTYEKKWEQYKPGFEFIAALFSIQRGRDWYRQKRKESSGKSKPDNALYFIKKGLDKLPWQDERFCRQLIGRACFFSKFMSGRRIRDIKLRFSNIKETTAHLEIVAFENLKTS